jgi:hypothetical protein
VVSLDDPFPGIRDSLVVKFTVSFYLLPLSLSLSLNADCKA